MGGEVSNSEIVVTKYCYIVKDAKALQIELKTGITDDKYTEVLQGITSNDDLIVIGQHSLSNAQKVKIVED